MRTAFDAVDWCVDNPLCDGNLGIPRRMMPQIRDVDAFVRWLEQEGYRVTRDSVRASDLKPTQEGITRRIVQKQIAEGVSLLAKRPLVRSAENHILDGHHRWAAIVESDPDRPIPTITVHVSTRKLLELGNAFPGVGYGSDVRANTIRTAYVNPTLRVALLPILRRG